MKDNTPAMLFGFALVVALLLLAGGLALAHSEEQERGGSEQTAVDVLWDALLWSEVDEMRQQCAGWVDVDMQWELNCSKAGLSVEEFLLCYEMLPDVCLE